MSALLKAFKAHLGLVAVLCVFLVLVFHWFEGFPNGWDQAEYALCLKGTYLPHSPYLLHFVAGKLLHLLVAPPLALSLVSAGSGVVAVVLFYGVVLRMFSGSVGRGLAAAGAGLMGLSFGFVRQASTQEVYVFQACLILLSIFVLLAGRRWRLVWSGVAFGCAVGAHNSSLLVVPAMVVAVAGLHGERRVRAVLWFVVPVAATCAVLAAVLWVLVPPPAGENGLGYLLGYLRGSSPRLPTGVMWERAFLAGSVRGLWHRLFSAEVAFSRLPRASGPLGLSVLHLVAAAVGLVACVRSDRWQGVFWLLYPLPFLCHEVLLGRNLDYGLYVPFVLPPLCGLTVLALGAVGEWGRGRRGAVWLQAGAVAVLLVPSAMLHWRHWGRAGRERAEHYSSLTTLAAIWMSRHLPDEAVVIQPAWEENPNLLAYYWGRQYAWCAQDEAMLLEGSGPFTPMNMTAFVPLTTERLTALIAAGRPVYAFEPDPLARCGREVIDSGAFAWRRAAVVDLDEVGRLLRVSGRVRRELPTGRLRLYAGSLKPPPVAP